MKKKANPKKPSKLPWIVAGIIVALTLVAYLPSFQNEFTNWDDNVYVVENEMITSLDGAHLKDMFTKPVSLNYHPLTMLSLGVNYAFGKLEPFGYHTTNILLHLLNTLLVFLFIQRLTEGRWLIAAITACCFGVHPMHVESVSWISERKDVLYTAFYLGALLLYLKYLDTAKYLHLALAFVLMLAACLSKAMAVTIPVVLVLIDYYRKMGFHWRLVWEKAPFLVVSVIFGVAALNIQSKGAIAEFETFTVWQRFMFASYGLLEYIIKFFVPTNLSAFYPYPNLDGSGDLPVVYYAAPFIALILIGGAIWSMRHNRAVFFGLAFYVVTVALVLQFISVGRAIIADRYAYIPYIGLAFVLGWWIDQLFEKRFKTKAGMQWLIQGALVVAFLVLTSMTYQRTQIWKNSITLWSDVIEKYPNQVDVAYKNRGNYYGQNNQLDKALKDYEVLLQLKTDDPKVYSNLGNIYALRQEFDKSLNAYSLSIKQDSSNVEAYVNRGITYAKMGRFTESLADYDQALNLQPNNLRLFSYKGYTYNQMRAWDLAVKTYSYVLSQQQNDPEAFFQRGLAYFNLNQLEAAKQDYQHTLQIRPNYPEAYFNLSIVEFKLGNTAKALEHARKAQSLGYQVPGGYLEQLGGE